MRKLVSFLILSCIAFSCLANGSSANTEIQLKVVINVNDDADSSNIQAAIDKANEIFEQANISLEVQTTRPNETAGDPNGLGLTPAQRNAVRRNGQQVLRDEVEAGKGIKIDLVNRVSHESEGVLGVAVHRNPVIIIAPDDDPNELGKTIAHEICHVLTIDYDLYDPNDIARLMYGYSGSGTDLTDAEIEEIRRGARRRGAEVSVTPEKVPKDSTTTGGAGKSYVMNAFGAILDDFMDIEIEGPFDAEEFETFGYADIAEVMAFAPRIDSGYGDLEITIQTSPSDMGMQQFSVESIYLVSFMTDDGMNLGQIQLGAESGEVVTAEFFDSEGETGLFPVTAQIIIEREFLNMPEYEPPANYTVLINAPIEIVLENLIAFEPVLVNVSGLHIDNRYPEPIMIWDQTESFELKIAKPLPPQQNIAVGRLGDEPTVYSSGLTAGQPVFIELQDYRTKQSVLELEAIVDDSGNLVKYLPPIPDGIYALRISEPGIDPTEMSLTAETVISYCSKGILQGDLNGDCEVNMLDFLILASEWLQ